MSESHRPIYGTIGHRVSMQLLSPTGYGGSGGCADLEGVYNDFFLPANVLPDCFKFQMVPTENVDFFTGPDIVVGHSENESGYLDKPIIAFIYDDLDFDNETVDRYDDTYQAHILFEKSLSADDNIRVSSILKHALTLMSLKANMQMLTVGKCSQITLGIKEEILQFLPDIGKTMLAADFVQNNQFSNTYNISLFHKNPNANPFQNV